MSSAKVYLSYYKQKLERLKEDDETTILETIQKLSKPSVTAELLQETGIYKSVQKLTRRRGKVADGALPLYNKWKLLLSISMKEKALKNFPPLVEAPHPAPSSNHLPKPRPDSTRPREAEPARERVQHTSRSDPFAPDSTQDRSHRSRDTHADRPSRGHPPQDIEATRSVTSSNHVSRQREDSAPDHARSRPAHDLEATRPVSSSNRVSRQRENLAPDHSRSHPVRDPERRETRRQREESAPGHSRGHRIQDFEGARSVSSSNPAFKQEDPAPCPPRGHPIQDFEAARSVSSSDRAFRKEDSAPNSKISRNPSHRSSDSDSEKSFRLQASESERHSKQQAARRDYEANIFGDPCPQTVLDNSRLQREPFDSETPANGGYPEIGLSSCKKEPFDPEASAIDGYSGRSSENKDYLAPDTTRPNSRSSDPNGVCSSQDGSSNPMDIDSLSNPNLNIEAPQSSDADCSPTKSSKIFEPYYIEMKEGMFRAVKREDGAISSSGKLVFELIHREIMKGSYRRDKFDEQKCSELFGVLKETPSEPPHKPDLKRKSSSPCPKEKRARHDRDSSWNLDKRVCPDSTSDHKLKVKKEEKSPSQAYKPINNIHHAHQSNCDRNKFSKVKDSPPPENAGMEFISSKKERRSIYSGKKCVQEVSTLLNSCQRFLKKNLDCVRGPKHVPYEVLQPILETLNPSQLAKVEEHNPYLLSHTNTLWKQHCNRDYRGLRVMKSEKDVIWKDEYNRAHDQQKKKLKNLTASINASASKAKPDRQAKLTVVETQPDPSRRRSKAVEVPSSKVPRPASPAPLGRRSTSPAPKPSLPPPPLNMPLIVMKQQPKETPKHIHKPLKKVVAPLMSKVKKSMACAYRPK